MPVVLFVGRPGSGKSTAKQYFHKLLLERGKTVFEFGDYEILKSWGTTHPERVRLTTDGGFEVVDLTAFNDALVALESRVKELEGQAIENAFVLVEFARQNYQSDIETFSPEFRNQAHVFFVETDLDTCIARIGQRVVSNAADRHPVPDSIMRSYYFVDNLAVMSNAAELKRRERAPECFVAFDNAGTAHDLRVAVDHFLSQILQRSS